MSVPPPLDVDDDAPVRRDVVSEDVRKAYPDMESSCSTSAERLDSLRRNDEKAFERIRHRFPKFTPPSLPRKKPNPHEWGGGKKVEAMEDA